MRWYHQRYHVGSADRRPAPDLDPTDLASTGWGVIFPTGSSPKLREALRPLLDHRRAQATGRFEHYYREIEYIPGESKRDFLRRLQVGPGPVHPDDLPYYLLIVGDPEEIPYRFQSLLDVQFAVGRIHFDNAEDYRRYAESVVAAEHDRGQARPELAVFSVGHENDEATRRLQERMVYPLTSTLGKERPDCRIRWVERAGKAELASLLESTEPPGLLLVTAHGLTFPNGHPAQRELQGAIVCQDWPGPGSGPVLPGQYFAAGDVGDGAHFHGMIAFLLNDYSAGTPRVDNYPHRDREHRVARAPRSFTAPLAQRLLSHPNGGALAVLGHVGRIWDPSFEGWHGKGFLPYKHVFHDLLDGRPVGSAADWLGERFAELSTDLADVLDEGANSPPDPSTPKLASLWRAINDARSFTVLGDPAVRLVTRTINRREEVATASFRLESPEPSEKLKVFLCHATEDKPAVRGLYRRLGDAGFSPWLDEEDLLPGQDWRKEIGRSIQESHAFLVCLSKTSVTKEGFVQSEVRKALDAEEEKPENTIFIIPLRLEPCTVPDRLSRWHYVDLFSEDGFEKLTRALRRRGRDLRLSE